MANQHTTNYQNSFIQVAEDCTADRGTVPATRAGKMTVAGLQHAMITAKPYGFTSDDVIFATSAAGRALDSSTSKKQREIARTAFFSKPQACMRSSALGKQFGWGVHSDSKGRIALVPVESDHYQALASDPDVKQLKAMRSARA